MTAIPEACKPMRRIQQGSFKHTHTPQTAHLCMRPHIQCWPPKIERIISLLSASPVGEARLPMPKGMAYKD
jgi:hypothetical protein